MRAGVHRTPGPPAAAPALTTPRYPLRTQAHGQRPVAAYACTSCDRSAPSVKGSRFMGGSLEREGSVVAEVLDWVVRTVFHLPRVASDSKSG
jgi:hypothetical protein